VAEQSDGFIDHSRPKPDSEDHDWGESEASSFVKRNLAERNCLDTVALENLESVFAFAYVESYAEALVTARMVPQAQWPTYVAVVPDGHTPQWSEAVERHQHLHDHGPSPCLISSIRSEQTESQ
jgi:hypothetical protein